MPLGFEAKRNTRFDLFRIAFASLVLLSHAPEITDGNTSHELFSRLTRSDVTFGAVAVDGFFLLSGFLIVQSWESDPELWNYLRKRLLRIVPGYLVAVLLSVAVVGWLAPGVPHFFHAFQWKDLKSIALLSSPATPPVFPGQSYPLVNGAMWTIGYEFRCYLLVALMGLCGLLRRRLAWLALTVAFLALAIYPWHEAVPVGAIETLLGEPSKIFPYGSAFLVGGSFYLFRDRTQFRALTTLLVVVVLLVGLLSGRDAIVQSAVVLCGGYLLFYLAQRPRIGTNRRFPDISYGIYLHGWPVESLLIFYFHWSPWVTFAVSLAICACLGWLSWHLVERPMLRLKRRASAPLPPG
jgi:peptidoglycan/LPS O-acetylase OafA/YrhL